MLEQNLFNKGIESFIMRNTKIDNTKSNYDFSITKTYRSNEIESDCSGSPTIKQSE